MAKTDIERHVDLAIEHIASVHFQSIRGESKEMVLQALGEIETTINQAIEAVKNM
ncbi:hypothetical protein JOC36_000836 [Weissella uvarum]|uniref:hypothetical protein n=1 Tax=Lactobacillaceae TaxID=33958 RepID=UPI001961726C|nr:MULTISPECIES: hypothetical protein [Lactobacillaceae]MBM7617287.1 hypothetical protein [Weissella uvarum]MCM0595210.1 hypothetical protein [Weissella uvarum]MCM0601494.1 hypothetical protein [Periweissella ghanensis]